MFSQTEAKKWGWRFSQWMADKEGSVECLFFYVDKDKNLFLILWRDFTNCI